MIFNRKFEIKRIINHRKFNLTSLIIYKSGKWPMADVVVVDIFMSYITFEGIIKGQHLTVEVNTGYCNCCHNQSNTITGRVLGFSLLCHCNIIQKIYVLYQVQ